jgi:zinc-binding alcohol dehydrogenase/oxidoreductase
VVLPSLWWGGDERAPGPRFEILGDRTRGTYAELVRVPEECVAPKPRGLSFEQAAALPLAGVTAHRALFGRGALRPGETVAVLGAGSGVSTFAVALARLAGARVLVTSSSEDKLARARELGADDGVLYTDADWPERLRALTPGGAGADLVVDSAGTWADSLGALRAGGRLVVLGATAADAATLAVRPFFFGQFSILGTTMGSPRDFAALLALVDANPSCAPVVDSVRPLAEAAEAHAAMERREHFGKLVLAVG